MNLRERNEHLQVWITNRLSNRISSWIIFFMMLVLIAFLAPAFLHAFGSSSQFVSSNIITFLIIGFFAQLIDGALGMAYGVSCNSLLLYFGIHPVFASAAVHTAEVFTTGVSGISHLKLKNVDKKLFLKLVVSGVPGAVVGAILLAGIFDGSILRPFVASYLLILGVVIFVKGIRDNGEIKAAISKPGLLAFAGGFLDSIGGGGWGPVVTSSLIARSHEPGKIIGTVNTAEFFVSFFSAGVFLIFIGIEHLDIILGLIAGGAVAAPFGALFAAKAPKKILFILVGMLLFSTSMLTLIKSLLQISV